MTSATFESVPNVMREEDMWQITVEPVLYLSQRGSEHLCWILLRGQQPHLWMMNKGFRYVEPGTQMYEGGNVTIFFLSHIFFLISVIRCPYFRFAPQYEEVDHYLLTFDPLSPPLFRLL